MVANNLQHEGPEDAQGNPLGTADATTAAATRSRKDRPKRHKMVAGVKARPSQETRVTGRTQRLIELACDVFMLRRGIPQNSRGFGKIHFGGDDS